MEDNYLIDAIKLDIPPEQMWIISKELIARLGLKPNSKAYSLAITGEDGNMYEWCEVLKAHMDWIESKCK